MEPRGRSWSLPRVPFCNTWVMWRPGDQLSFVGVLKDHGAGPGLDWLASCRTPVVCWQNGRWRKKKPISRSPNPPPNLWRFLSITDHSTEPRPSSQELSKSEGGVESLFLGGTGTHKRPGMSRLRRSRVGFEDLPEGAKHGGLVSFLHLREHT